MNDNVVSYYITGQAQTKIHFPNGDVSCKWCHLYLRYEEQYKRYSCRLLPGEWILNPMQGIPANCPLKFEEVK